MATTMTLQEQVKLAHELVGEPLDEIRAMHAHAVRQWQGASSRAEMFLWSVTMDAYKHLIAFREALMLMRGD